MFAQCAHFSMTALHLGQGSGLRNVKATRGREVPAICCFSRVAISSCFSTLSSRVVEPAVLGGFMHVCRCARCGWAAGKTVFSRPRLQVRAVRSGQGASREKKILTRHNEASGTPANLRPEPALLDAFADFPHDARTQEPGIV